MEEEINLAYWTGLFEGEGSIMILMGGGKKFMDHHKRRTPYFYAATSFGMINEELVVAMRDFFGRGSIYKEASYHKKRPMFRWHTTTQDTKIILNKMLGRMRLKKEQALLALKFIDECGWPLGLNKSLGSPLWLLEKRKSIYLQMKKLNGVDISSVKTTEANRQGRLKGIRSIEGCAV